MNSTTRNSGIRITLPDQLMVTAASGPIDAQIRAMQMGRGRSGRAGSGSRGPISLDAALIEAFTQQEMELLDHFQVGQRRHRFRTPTREAENGKMEPVGVEIELAPGEDAIVLSELDGTFAWHLPVERSPESRREVPVSATHSSDAATRHFEIPSSLERPNPSTRSYAYNRGTAVEALRIIVFKFIARHVVDGAVDVLERNVCQGFTIINGIDPSLWKQVDDLGTVPVPQARQARILLLIHGTFSNSLGAFAALGAMPWGKTFLEECLATYDLVLGFDHYTLSADPYTNAQLLGKLLRQAFPILPPAIHIICHSRGGLVVRSLLVQVLPEMGWQPQIEQVIFVGVPNGGTSLASPEHWHTFVNLYTNIAVASCRVLAQLPSMKIAPLILQELVQSLGVLLKSIVSDAIAETHVPGLTVMRPESDFITQLNQQHLLHLAEKAPAFFAITSEFEARLIGGENEPLELSRRFLITLTDTVTDAFMQNANDLVVDTKFMTASLLPPGEFFYDRLEFGRTPQVYHTNYFARPEVVNALRRWLNLSEGRPASIGDLPLSRGSARRGRARLVNDLPIAINPNILTVPAFYTVDDLLHLLDGSSPDYVVIEAFGQTAPTYYAFPTGEVQTRVRTYNRRSQTGDAPTLFVLFELDMAKAWPTLSSLDVWQADLQIFSAFGESRPSLVLADRRPVGVYPSQYQLLSNMRLARIAAEVEYERENVTRGSEGDRPVFRGGGDGTTRGEAKSIEAPALETPSMLNPTASAVPLDDSGLESASQTKHLHFAAEMNDQVVIAQSTTLRVRISPEALAIAQAESAAIGEADAKLAQTLIVQIYLRQNFRMEPGLDRLEVDPASIEQTADFYFDLEPTNLGEGEVQVIVRQGMRPLVTLTLRTKIVDTPPAHDRKVAEMASLVQGTSGQMPSNQLRILERINGNEVRYEYELSLQEAGIFHRYESRPIVGSRQEYVDRIYRTIEESWLQNKEDFDNFADEMRAMGADIWNELLPPELQTVLWTHRHQIESIQVISTEPFIPWELVHLKEPGQPLPLGEVSFLGQMGMVRWLHNSWPPQYIRVRPGRMRYLIPNYILPEDRLPEAAKERDYLHNRFGAEEVIPETKQLKVLLGGQGSFDLLHFAGHGSAEVETISESFLELQDRSVETRTSGGSVAWEIRPDYFRVGLVKHFARLKDAQGNRPLVFLNACQAGRLGRKLTSLGGFAEAFLNGGAGAFVGALWAVGDQPSRAFVEAFYDRLAAGETIAQATSAAREQARSAGDGSWLAYTVYAHPDALVVWEP